LSDTATSGTADETPALASDTLREGIVDGLRAALGDQLLDVKLVPGTDLWARVTTEAWRDAGLALRDQGFHYFCFLSAIDWLPSPYGRGEDDPSAPAPERSTEIVHGYTGGETRFQVFARVTDIERHVGVTVKADVPDVAAGESPVVDSWVTNYAGANWHERECHEMFGIRFAGHPDLRNMYLPTDFEGYPLRKDFPLLARLVKPWPGIVDVEPLPGEGEEAEAGAGEGASE
jgi:NADH-quinone oxidoreductase subunit C